MPRSFDPTRLTPRQAEAWRLRCEQRLSARAIAEDMAVSEGKVRDWLLSARRRIANATGQRPEALRFEHPPHSRLRERWQGNAT
jgi:predicted DNA-binding protein (UPF0251 family)